MKLDGKKGSCLLLLCEGARLVWARTGSQCLRRIPEVRRRRTDSWRERRKRRFPWTCWGPSMVWKVESELATIGNALRTVLPFSVLCWSLGISIALNT